jgi:hypothetical protein
LIREWDFLADQDLAVIAPFSIKVGARFVFVDLALGAGGSCGRYQADGGKDGS